MQDTTRLYLLTWLLRVCGLLLMTAFLAVFLPADWMASTHRRLGMGEFPAMPVVLYLARSLAALYGFHGVLLLVVANDPVRYRPVIAYIAWVNVVFGAAIVAIDLHAGMPRFWTLAEGPPIAALGVVIGLLNRAPADSRRAVERV